MIMIRNVLLYTRYKARDVMPTQRTPQPRAFTAPSTHRPWIATSSSASPSALFLPIYVKLRIVGHAEGA